MQIRLWSHRWTYEVTVTATDPSGSEAMVTVTINVVPVNEAPIITRVTDPCLLKRGDS